MKFRYIKSADELRALVNEVGILPLFKCEVEGFSAQDCTPAEYWFNPDTEGLWEWRMELARSGRVVYAKLLGGRAALVSFDWYPHLANYRRNGYDFDALCEEGLAPVKLKIIMDALEKEGALLSHELKAVTGVKGFDSLITKLQMQTYVAVKGFDYRLDRYGKSYGWGIACYDVSERTFGADFVKSRYGTEPGESFALLLKHLKGLCPDTEEKKLLRLLF